jgi:hypothetical protein
MAGNAPIPILGVLVAQSARARSGPSPQEDAVKSWLSRDDQGRSILVRQGVGHVTCVVPVGIPGPDGAHALYRAEIEVVRPAGSARAIRLSTHGLLRADDPSLILAQLAQSSQDEMVWQIAWHRHPWVPADIEVTSLDLVNDAQAWLVHLARVGSAQVDDMNRQLQDSAALERLLNGALGEGGEL